MKRPNWLNLFGLYPKQPRPQKQFTWASDTTEEYDMAEGTEGTEDFEAIVGNFNSQEGQAQPTIDCENVLDLVAHHWKDFHPSEIYIKGLCIVEAALPDGRVLRRITTPGMAEWEALGFLETVKQQIIAEGVVEAIIDTDCDHDDDEDDD